MDYIYFLLQGGGPEVDAIKTIEAKIKAVNDQWWEFVEKYAPGHEALCGNSLLGIKFPRGEAPPEGWMQVERYGRTFRPKATSCRDAYKEWKALPQRPRTEELGFTLGAKEVLKPGARGVRVLWVSHHPMGADFILKCPVSGDGEFYKPKGTHREMLPSEVAKLYKKGG